MSNITNQPAAPRQPLRVEGLVPYRRQINYGLLVLAAAFAVIPIYIAAREGLYLSTGPVFLWGCALAGVHLILGLVGLGYQGEGELSDADKLRLQLLAVGGLAGLFTAVLGFVLPFTTYRETLAKGLEAWREQPGALIYPGLAQIGGLALMFISLQLGRGLERRNQNIRRLIYGYNAVLMTLLLLDVLALPNVLAYAEPFTRFFGRPYDWARDEYNTVSPVLRNYLADLREPVKVTLIMQSRDWVAQDTQTLLESCRSLSNKFSWELLSPTDPQNASRLEELMQKYTLPDSVGMLVVVGGEKGKGDHEFVRRRDLIRTSQPNPMSEPKVEYLGENALLNAMTILTEGKVVLYFTQGHGELSAEAAPPPGMMGRPPTRGPDSISNLRGKLSERRSFDVKTLTIDRTTKKVPDDATAVIIARPTQEFSPGEVKVLREYAQRNEEKDKEGKVTRPGGKLFVLLNPVLLKEGGATRMARTGLEPLLAEYNVRVGDDRILTLHPRVRDPLEVVALANPRSPNPIARAFGASIGGRQVFRFRNVRTVEPRDEKAAGAKTVDRLLLVPPDLYVFAEKDLGRDPVAVREALLKNEELANKTISQVPLCMAVAVSDSGAPPGVPRDPAHAGMMKDTPRMIVFGTSGWITDEAITQRGGDLELDLFNSCLAWLREASSIGQRIPGKTRGEYRLNIPETETNRLVFLPLGLMVLGVVGLGTGVWVVRRR